MLYYWPFFSPLSFLFTACHSVCASNATGWCCRRYCSAIDQGNFTNHGVQGYVSQFVVDAGNRNHTHIFAMTEDDTEVTLERRSTIAGETRECRCVCVCVCVCVCGRVRTLTLIDVFRYLKTITRGRAGVQSWFVRWAKRNKKL